MKNLFQRLMALLLAVAITASLSPAIYAAAQRQTGGHDPDDRYTG